MKKLRYRLRTALRVLLSDWSVVCVSCTDGTADRIEIGHIPPQMRVAILFKIQSDAGGCWKDAAEWAHGELQQDALLQQAKDLLP